MKTIFLDNAATTPVRQEVIDAMVAVLQNDFGNPSSTHSIGRSAKAIVEQARKSIAKCLNCAASEIIFTSSATESTNWIIRESVASLGIKNVISAKTEHHATLYTLQSLEKKGLISLHFVDIKPNGEVDYAQLEDLVSTNDDVLVSLMHINNETGVVNNIRRIASICQQHNALFHCDTVQSIGKMHFDLSQSGIDFLVASAHKFHGPKGIGFAYINKKHVLQPMLTGGEQEKGWRAGTEAVHQIAGLAKALELSLEHLEEEQHYIEDLKAYCWNKISDEFPDAVCNGDNTFYPILNVRLPFSEEKTALMLFNLDMKGIAVSRGSACQSGSTKPSHVLAQMLTEDELKKPSIRISFSHYNTKEEIDYLVDVLKSI